MILYGLAYSLDGCPIAAHPFYSSESDTLAAAVVLVRTPEIGIVDDVSIVRFEGDGKKFVITDTRRVPQDRGAA